MRDGYDSNCKPCYAAKTREYRANNLEKVRESQRLSALKTAAKRKVYYKQWSVDNAEFLREYRQATKEKRKRDFLEWSRKNWGKLIAKKARRRAAYFNAFPAWADCEAITEIYRICKEASDVLGVPHQVDHIVPLQHPKVCGLHVQWNLQVLTDKQNQSKKNRLIGSYLKPHESFCDDER